MAPLKEGAPAHNSLCCVVCAIHCGSRVSTTFFLGGNGKILGGFVGSFKEKEVFGLVGGIIYGKGFKNEIPPFI